MAYQRGMQGGMQRSPAPMPARSPQGSPTVGQRLATRSAGLGDRTQESDFLANLGLTALKNAYQMDMDRRSRVQGTMAPPTPGRMEQFRQSAPSPRPAQQRMPRQRPMGQMQRPQQRQMSQFAQLGQQPMMMQQPRPFFNAPQMPQYGGFGSMPQPQFSPMMQYPGQFSQFGGGMMQAPMMPYY